MGLKDIHGNTLDDQWKKAAYTYLGVTVADYPNMFHLYGPQGPTLLSNGPTTIEVQGRWITDVIKYCERNNVKYINPTQEAQAEWKKKINHLSDISLFPTVKSTYMGEYINADIIPYPRNLLTRCLQVEANPTKRSSRRTMLADCTTMARRFAACCRSSMGFMWSMG